MTIAAANTEIAYVADGASVAYSLACEVQLAGDFVATLDSVVTTAYVLTGLGSSGGVVCTFTVAPTAGVRVVLARIAPYNRVLYDYGLGGLNPDTLDDDLDRLDMQTQQIATILNRVPRVKRGDLTIGLDLVPEASKLWAWNGAANAVVNVDVTTVTPLGVAMTALGQSIVTSATTAAA